MFTVLTVVVLVQGILYIHKGSQQSQGFYKQVWKVIQGVEADEGTEACGFGFSSYHTSAKRKQVRI